MDTAGEEVKQATKIAGNLQKNSRTAVVNVRTAKRKILRHSLGNPLGSIKKFIVPRKKDIAAIASAKEYNKNKNKEAIELASQDETSPISKTQPTTFLYPPPPPKKVTKNVTMVKLTGKTGLTKKELKERKEKRRISLEVLGIIRRDIADIAKIRAQKKASYQEKLNIETGLQQLPNQREPIKVTVSEGQRNQHQFQVEPSTSKGKELVGSRHHIHAWVAATRIEE